jgi:hypothetical protein
MTVTIWSFVKLSKYDLNCASCHFASKLWMTNSINFNFRKVKNSDGRIIFETRLIACWSLPSLEWPTNTCILKPLPRFIFHCWDPFQKDTTGTLKCHNCCNPPLCITTCDIHQYQSWDKEWVHTSANLSLGGTTRNITPQISMTHRTS